ncbi:MAG: rhodanese-like domain-containing protein [Methanoregula sp.]|jgi:rhodanese-related sulfurtransferase|nr:rhodanese-like domain-containing protein [Methanoregula sp.]
MEIKYYLLFTLLAVLIICAGCTQNISPSSGTPAPVSGYHNVTPQEAKDLIASEKDLVIIDVSPIYALGHLEGAIRIPIDQLDAKIPTLDKTKPYLVYCHSDTTSISGAQKLVQAVFPRVYRLLATMKNRSPPGILSR